MTLFRKKQLLEKHKYLTENMIKNWLFKDVNGFRNKVVRRVGRTLFFSEPDLMTFIHENRG